MHLKLTAVQPVRLRKRGLPVELRQRLPHVIVRQSNEAQQPVQPKCRIPPSAGNLSILDRRTLPQRCFRFRQASTRDMHHRHLGVAEAVLDLEEWQDRGERALVQVDDEVPEREQTDQLDVRSRTGGHLGRENRSGGIEDRRL